MATTYQQAMASPDRQLTLRGTVKPAAGSTLALTADDVLSFTCDEGASGGMLLGGTAAQCWSLTLSSPDGAWKTGGARLGAATLIGAVLSIEIGVRTGGAYAYYPAGAFIATDIAAPEGEDTVTLTGLDPLAHAFAGAFTDTLTYPQPLSAILAHIAGQAGVTLHGQAACNANAVMLEKPDWGARCTLRRALGWTAGALGCMAVMRRQGGYELAAAWPSALSRTLDGHQATRLTLSPGAFALNRLRVTPRGKDAGAEDIDRAINPALPAGADNTLTIADNALLSYRAADLPGMAQGVLDALAGMAFAPFSCEYPGDPTLRPGDRLMITDLAGESHSAQVFSQRLTWDAGGLRGRISCDMATGGVSLPRVLSAHGTLAGSALCDGVVTANKIAAGAVTANKIAANTITADRLAAGLITADSALIAEGAIGTTQIADGSITDAKIVTLTADKLTAGTIDASIITVNNLVADNIKTGTINGQRIPVLGTDKVADGAITGDKVANEAIATDKLVASAVTADKLAANSVIANKILAGAVTTDKLAANAVTAAKIAAGAIETNHISAEAQGALVLEASNAVRVGGKNLLLNSGVPVEGTGYPIKNYAIGADKPAAGETVTVTVWGELGEGKTRFGIYNSGSNASQRIGFATRTGDVGPYTLTAPWIAYGGDATLRIYPYPSSVTVSSRIDRIKLERGNKSTDWTPCPEDPAVELKNSAIEISQEGIDMKSTGSITMRSGSKIEVLSGGSFAVNVGTDAAATVNKGVIWHSRNLIVSSQQPTDAKKGDVWIKPNAIKTGDWTRAALTSRPWGGVYETSLAGVALGASSGAGGYVYHVRVPIFRSFTAPDASDSAIVYLALTQAALAQSANRISCGEIAFTDKGGLWYEATVTSNLWLGNAPTLWMRMTPDSGNYLTVDSGKPFVLSIKDMSGTGAGWLACEVSYYA